MNPTWVHYLAQKPLEDTEHTGRVSKLARNCTQVHGMAFCAEPACWIWALTCSDGNQGWPYLLKLPEGNEWSKGHSAHCHHGPCQAQETGNSCWPSAGQ